MRRTKRDIKRTIRTTQILHDLYNHRAMTTSQLAKRHNYSMRHMYRLTQDLRKKKLIISGSIRGYTAKRSHQGNYHRISSRGISYLSKQGIQTKFSSDELRISSNYLPYVLSLNDMSINLTPYGWKVFDSREVKRSYGLNFSEKVDGMLESPNGEKYTVYIFINPYTRHNLQQVKGEIERNSRFQRILFLAKSKEAFEQIINEFNSYLHIVQYQSFKVLPFNFASKYLKVFNSQEVIFDYLSSYGIELLSPMEKQQSGLQVIVKHKGKQKYLVNMLDNDLTHLQTILNYRRDKFQRDGRRVLLVTNLPTVYKQLLSDIHHIDYLRIAQRDLSSYIETELSRINGL